MPFIILIMVYI